MSYTDDAAGVFEAIDAEQGAHAPVDQSISEPKGEGGDADTENTNTTKQTEVVPEESKETQTPTDKGTETSTETTEPSKTETQTEAAAEEVTFDESQLPPPPQGYQGKVPEVDPETGQITNMTPAEYATYMRETTKAELRLEGYNAYVENAALDAAEKILPDMKTNPSIRQLVENARVASIYQGKMINSFEAAKLVRDALGIAPAKIAEAKAQATQNAKTSITVQKNAALETSSSQQGDSEADDVTRLQKRIRRGDSEAFVELLGIWEKDGKI
ncbi:hypothetical protein [Caudoviricetes sp.]|nr:hypothetical protein [Caudoviricetes sp.]